MPKPDSEGETVGFGVTSSLRLSPRRPLELQPHSKTIPAMVVAAEVSSPAAMLLTSYSKERPKQNITSGDDCCWEIERWILYL